MFRLHDGGHAVVDVIEVAAVIEAREGGVFGLVGRVRRQEGSGDLCVYCLVVCGAGMRG